MQEVAAILVAFDQHAAWEVHEVRIRYTHYVHIATGGPIFKKS